MIILFIATICSLWGALWSLSLIDEINPQHGFNFTKNAWIFWCWLPLPIVSIILGFIFESKGFKCTKNIVAGFIIGFLLLVYGSFGLIPSFSKDYSKINDYKEYIDASIPNNGELEIQNWKTYFDDDKTEYVIINAYYDKEDVSNLLSSIQNSNNWVLSTKMKSELKIYYQHNLELKKMYIIPYTIKQLMNIILFLVNLVNTKCMPCIMINHLNNYQYIDTNIHTINKKNNIRIK